MDMNQVFERLCKLAAMPVNGRQEPLLACDLVTQDNLYEVQDALCALLLDVAKTLGPEKQKALAAKFPYAFTPAK